MQIAHACLVALHGNKGELPDAIVCLQEWEEPGTDTAHLSWVVSLHKVQKLEDKANGARQRLS